MNRSPDTVGIISDRDLFISVLTNIIGVLTLTFHKIRPARMAGFPS